MATVGSAARPNAWPTDGSGLARAMRLALADAALDASDIDVVFATANGSPALDRLEAAALGDVFGGRDVPVASIKGSIGESASSGAAAVAAAVGVLSRGLVPPTAGFERPDPMGRVAVSARSRAATGTTCLVNSVASGGTNCSLVLRLSGPRA